MIGFSHGSGVSLGPPRCSPVLTHPEPGPTRLWLSSLPARGPLSRFRCTLDSEAFLGAADLLSTSARVCTRPSAFSPQYSIVRARVLVFLPHGGRRLRKERALDTGLAHVCLGLIGTAENWEGL